MSQVFSFDRHRRYELTLFTALERLREIAEHLEQDELVAIIRQALDRITDHGFSIAVVGEFNRGKSTVINALLGKAILPADIVPTSATVNRVTYGLRPAATIRFRSDGAQETTEQKISIHELESYITKLTDESTTRAANIEESIVSYPNPFLKNNVDIIDTPGLSDEAAMTDVTMEVIPKVDAAIMVVMATAPFAETEAHFLESLLIDHGLGRVVFLVTGMDRIAPADRDRVLDAIRERIEQRIVEQAERRFADDSEACAHYLARIGPARVFGISGHQALQGKMNHDPELLEASGFGAFETFLEQFLTVESGLVALRTHVERVLQLCQQLEASLGTETAPPPPIDTDEISSFFLDSVADLAQEGRQTIDQRHQEANQTAETLFNELPAYLYGEAETVLSQLTIDGEDLKPDRLAAALDRYLDQISQHLATSSRGYAESAVTTLGEAWEPATVAIDELEIVAERVLRHVTGTESPPSPPPMPEAATHEARLDRFQPAFQLSNDWPQRVQITSLQEPKAQFIQGAVDFVREKKFKLDLRGSVLEAIRQDLDGDRHERWRQLFDQISADAERHRHDMRAIETRVQAHQATLRQEHDNRIAEVQNQVRRRARFASDLASIRGQAQDLDRDLAKFDA
ncbi:MAG: dynamin family protein [Acidobacteriota bacterium]